MNLEVDIFIYYYSPTLAQVLWLVYFKTNYNPISKLKIMRQLLFTITILLFSTSLKSQTNIIQDDFEGNGTINTWYGDDCGINTFLDNPFQQNLNNSAKVLEYRDQGGQYANIRFDVNTNLDLSELSTFSLKIYVPSNYLTGNQQNKISIKLQDGNLNEPWTTQSEITKAITLDQWQEVSFDFQNDSYINYNTESLAPAMRTDFNRMVIQVNGEGNNDQVLAYIDDVSSSESIDVEPLAYSLVWADEFEAEGAVNSDKWFHQTLLPNGFGWYNSELQHYTNRIENASIDNGILKIATIKESYTDQGQTKEYTSARLNSKFAFTYGKVEIRAKLPFGVGTWPAIWTLGKNISEPGAYWQTEGNGNTPWPNCGEIDIMEHWGNNQNFIQSATHTPSSYGGTINHGGRILPTASTEFHIYTLEWTNEKLVFSVDDIIHYTYNPLIKDANTWPFDAAQYLLLNVAIAPDISPNFVESSMEVDYVRVYQESSLSTNKLNGFSNLSLYPNPITSEFTIQINEFIEGKVSVGIYSIDGRLLRLSERKVSGNSIKIEDLENLANGTYIIICKIKSRNYSFKVFKN